MSGLKGSMTETGNLKISYAEILAWLISLIYFLLFLWHFGLHGFYDGFALQAQAFIDGRLDVTPYLAAINITYPMDFTLRDGLYYWPLKPMPALLSVPFVALGHGEIAQAILKVLALLAIANGAYILARRQGVAGYPAAWLVLALLGGSVLVGPLWMSGPWYLANVISVAFGIWAICEYYGSNRPWLIGVLIACTWATRQTAGLALAIFFYCEILWQWRTSDLSRIWRRSLMMGLPVAAAIAALIWFDAARFGSPFDSGYGDSLLAGDETEWRREEHGLFNPIYFIQNIYWYFLALPAWTEKGIQVSTGGLSLFVISPVTLWLFARAPWEVDRASAWLAIGIVIPVLLAYYATGAVTFGPRYLNDILPLWFLLLVQIVQHRLLTRGFKRLVLLSVLLNGILFIRLG